MLFISRRFSLCLRHLGGPQFLVDLLIHYALWPCVSRLQFPELESNLRPCTSVHCAVGT